MALAPVPAAARTPVRAAPGKGRDAGRAPPGRLLPSGGRVCPSPVRAWLEPGGLAIETRWDVAAWTEAKGRDFCRGAEHGAALDTSELLLKPHQLEP